jgi:4,5-dihydroxyphthalate decarboxylase
MSRLKLTLACGDYDFLRPLINGDIQPQGIDLNVLTMASPERHGRMLRHEEFDVCELSLIAFPAPAVSSLLHGQKNRLRH